MFLPSLLATALLLPGSRPTEESVERRELSGDANDWEPSLDVGPDGLVAIVAIRRGPLPEDLHAPQSEEERRSFLPVGSLRPVIWISTDGGDHFGAPVHPSPSLHSHGDPRIRVDEYGDVLATWIGFDWDASGQMPVVDRGGLCLARSQDQGQSFELQTIAPLLAVGDKPELVLSPDGEEIHVAYTGRAGTLEVASSHDAGLSFETQVVASAPALYWPTSIARGPDGTTWCTYARPLDAIAGGSEVKVLELGRSRAGGRGFGTQRIGDSSLPFAQFDPETNLPRPTSCHGVVAQLPYAAVAVDDAGRVYLATTEGEAGSPYTLRFRRSEDQGETFGAPIVLSSAPRPSTNDTADVFYPMIAAAGDGLVYVAWFDDRTGPLNLWAKRSTDGGETWSKDVRLSRTDRDGFAGIYGEYGGIAIDEAGDLHAAWAEGVGHISRPEARGGVHYARWRPSRD